MPECAKETMELRQRAPQSIIAHRRHIVIQTDCGTVIGFTIRVSETKNIGRSDRILLLLLYFFFFSTVLFSFVILSSFFVLHQ